MHVSLTAAVLIHCDSMFKYFFGSSVACLLVMHSLMVRLTVVQPIDSDENNFKDYAVIYIIILLFLVICCGCCQLETCVDLKPHKMLRWCVPQGAHCPILTCTASINSGYSLPAVTLFTFCTLPRVMMTVPTASAYVLWKQARILWKNNTTDGWTHFFTEPVTGSQFGRRKTENKTRSVTLDPSDNDSASYYAFVLATPLTAASLLASACYGCLAEEPG